MEVTLGPNVKVEGSLSLSFAFDDNESSSTDEESFERGVRRAPREFDEDEDEELEVFDAAGNTVYTNKQNEGASIVNVLVSKENITPQMEDQQQKETKDMTKITASEGRSTRKEEIEVDFSVGIEVDVSNSDVMSFKAAESAFGIAYRPYGKTSTEDRGYDMKGKAFDDEDEFERDLQTSTVVARTSILGRSVVKEHEEEDEEDEFGFGDDNDPGDGESAVQKALNEAASRLTRGKQHQQDLTLLLEKSAELLAMPPPPPSQPISYSTSAASQKSLQEITAIYGAGLGDQRVALLDASSGNTVAVAGDTILPPPPPVKESFTIDEGDEEEEEASEAREAAEQAAVLSEEKQLEQVWNTVVADKEVENMVAKETAKAVDVVPPAPPVAVASGKLTKLHHYSSAETFFRSLDMSRHKSSIEVQSYKSSGLGFLFSRPPALKIQNADEELAFPFLVAKEEYCPAEPGTGARCYHVLEAIYFRLVGTLPPALTGGHWEQVGFQGRDPKTDLNRSMKMLTLLLTLNFVEMKPQLAKRVYRMSRLDTSGQLRPGQMDRSWPFMCVSIGFTKEALGALRCGALNKYVNREGSVMSVLQAFHQAQFYALAELLNEKPNEHHARHLAALREQCEVKPSAVLKGYWEAVGGGQKSGVQPKKSTAARNKWAAADDAPTFDGLQDVVAKAVEEGSLMDRDGGTEALSRRQKAFVQEVELW